LVLGVLALGGYAYVRDGRDHAVGGATFFIEYAVLPVRVAGVDLAVVRPSAIAVMDDCELVAYLSAMELEEIVSALSPYRPAVVAVDAPLSKPDGWLRDVERELRKLGYRLLPPLLGPMAKLTERGIRLAQMLGNAIEVHPKTSLRAMGLDPQLVYSRYRPPTKDHFDAVLAALTALAYLKGLYRSIGPFVLPLGNPCQ
jgi:predicted nuclease with RNAse H fold